jgi:predicted amidophosphoribosyltransferase
MVKCIRCGKDIDQYDYICWHCGASQTRYVDNIEVWGRTEEQREERKKKEDLKSK